MSDEPNGAIDPEFLLTPIITPYGEKLYPLVEMGAIAPHEAHCFYPDAPRQDSPSMGLYQVIPSTFEDEERHR